MTVNRKDKLFGQPILKVRDLLEKLDMPAYCGIENNNLIYLAAKVLEKSEDVAVEVLNELIINDFIGLEKKTGPDELEYYLVTFKEKGTLLRTAKATPLLTAEKAERLLKEFEQRVIEVNHDNDFAYIIESKDII